VSFVFLGILPARRRHVSLIVIALISFFEFPYKCRRIINFLGIASHPLISDGPDTYVITTGIMPPHCINRAKHHTALDSRPKVALFSTTSPRFGGDLTDIRTTDRLERIINDR
jgi:hypothetical protein